WLVQDVEHTARRVTDGERIIPDETLLEDQAVSLSRFCRFREIVREISTDEPLPRDPGNQFGCVVHVRDLPLGTDCDLGVETCFDEASRIGRGGVQLVLDLFPLCNVPCCGEER